MLNIALNLVSHMALIALCAYLVGRSRYIVACVNQPTIFPHWLTLTSIFSILSILGTYNGIPVEGALANTRLVGTLMSGIMGGPSVGLSVGIVSGLHRYWVGGFTAETCGVAAVLGGLCAGLIRQKIGLHNMTWKTAATIALVAEIVQKVLVLIFAKPFEAAWALEKIIAIPTTAVTVLGTVAFILIIKDIQAQQEAYSAKATELSLQIASHTLPFLRHGLNKDSASATAKIIFQLTGVDAVSITDREVILAYIGKGSDHHCTGKPILTHSTQQTLSSGSVTIVNTPEERGCPVPDCPIKAGVIAPLVVHGTIAGTVKLFSTKAGEMSQFNIKIARGLAELLSVQLELAAIDEQRKLLEKAELTALRAQINPHFLFNTISIIMSLCRTNPDTARTLLGHLGAMMQYSFANHGEFVTIADELEQIHSYVSIVQARFGARLEVHMNIDQTAQNAQIPVLVIQPLVENAIQHGLFPKISECILNISIQRDNEAVIISVSDNGIGIAPDKLNCLFSTNAEGIGLKNVFKRLKGLYGENYGLTVSSILGKGTTAVIRIPDERMVNSHAS